MANSNYEDIVKNLSTQELEYFKYACNTLDFASNLNAKSYVLDILNTTCSSLDTLVTGSRIVFDQQNTPLGLNL